MKNKHLSKVIQQQKNYEFQLLLGNLRLWSVITNESSYGKIRHVEVESLNREIRHSIDLYRLVVIYIFIIADMQYCKFCVPKLDHRRERK